MISRRRFIVSASALISVGMTRVRAGIFGDLGRRISRGAHKFGKWIHKAAKFARKVVRDARAALTELAMKAAPARWYFSRPHPLKEGLEFGEHDPVYLINGVDTKKTTARKNARVLAAVLRRPVFALHNDTSNELQGGMAGASIGAVFGGGLGAVVGFMAGSVVGGKAADYLETLADAIWTPPLPQHARVARQVAFLIKNSRRPISIVTHSQGCIQVLNGALTAAAYGHADKLRQVRWVMTGFDLRSLVDVQRTLNRFGENLTPICRWDDPIVLLSRGAIVPAAGGVVLNLDRHTFAWWVHEASSSATNLRTQPTRDAAGQPIPDTTRGYASMVRNSMLWPRTESNSQVGRAFHERTIEVTNHTKNVATVQWSQWARDQIGQVVREPHGAAGTQQISAQSTAVLMTRQRLPLTASHVAIAIECGGRTVYGDGSQPIQIAEAYVADEMEIFPIEIEDEDSDTRNNTKPFATTHIGGLETIWMGVQAEWAFTIDEHGEPGMYKQAPLPPSRQGDNDHYCYRSLLEPLEGVVMLPKTGNGEVRLVKSDGTELGYCYIERFNPDNWPTAWKPIEDEPIEDKVSPLPTFVLGVTSMDHAWGTMVISVVPGSPADNSGIVRGDVITAIGSEAIRSATHAERRVLQLQGQTVEVELIASLTGMLEIDPRAPFLGIQMDGDTMTVANVLPNSRCRQLAGPQGELLALEPGDTLLAIGDWFVGGRGDLRAGVIANAGRPVALRFVRPPIAKRVVPVTLNRVR